MEKGPCISDFSTETAIYGGFSLGMFDYRRVCAMFDSQRVCGLEGHEPNTTIRPYAIFLLLCDSICQPWVATVLILPKCLLGLLANAWQIQFWEKQWVENL